MSPATRKSSAFTLIEILVVICIIGIMIGIGIPNLYRRLNPDSVEMAAASVREQCERAREYAILQNVPVDLVISAETGEISRQVGGSAVSTTDASAGFEHAPPSALDDNFASEGPKSAVSDKPLLYPTRLPENVAIELIEVNFQNQEEYTEARVRFYPNGTSDEMKMLLRHVPSGDRRLITLEVVTAIVEVESDPSKWR